MGYGFIEGSLSCANGKTPSAVETGPVEEVPELVEPLAFNPHEVLPGDPYLFEGDLAGIGTTDGKLAVQFIGFITGPIGLHDDGTETLMLLLVLRGRDEDHQDEVTDAGVGNENFIPLNHVMIAVLNSR